MSATKKTTVLTTVTLGVLLLAQGSALAGGWGPFFGWAREEPTLSAPDFLSATLDADLPPFVEQAIEDADLDFELDHWTVGLLFDSAPYRDAVVNHRFAIGFDIISETRLEDIDIPGVVTDFRESDLDEDGYGIAARYALGIGLLRNEGFRWWAGPSVGVSWNHYDLENDAEAETFSGGGGAETGINLHLGSAASITVSGGFHWRAVGYGAGVNEVGDYNWGDGPFYFIQAGLLFHTGSDRAPATID
ncbi:MAG: hypothetical protein AB1640_18865 [bacterium]